ncbi:MAG TPA: hypothetical protein VGM88_21195 [Kofleriaceae bacterium]|jgi:hypothetical protein
MPRLISHLALAAIVVLAAMVAITLATGVSQETFEVALAPADYGAGLRAFALPLRALFGLDSAFLILYATLFILFAQHIASPPWRLVLRIAIGAILAAAVLDMIEDHHILAMQRAALRGDDPGVGEIAVEHVISQVKFHLAYLAEVLIGLALPRRTTAAKVLAFLLVVGTLVQGAWLYAAPDAALPAGNVGRWIGFFVGFALIIRVARRPGVAAAATDAPA